MILTESYIPDTVDSAPGEAPGVPAADSSAGAFLIRPLEDARWRHFVGWHPDASVYHSANWLRALHKTYGFEPLAFTTCSPREPLRNAWLFCRIDSWLTGARLVSLPFSDHCAPLATDPMDLRRLMDAITAEQREKHLRYLEIRPTGPLPELGNCKSTHLYRWHQMDLTQPIDAISRSLHKDCIARKIRRAERENLACLSGNSEELLQLFWRVYVPTRKRHKAPPQPIGWFRNLLSQFSDAATIRVAAKDGTPVAAILTLQFRESLVYKYGASDERFQSLGGSQILLWRSIQEAREKRLRTFDFGRSDYSNRGLILFKDRWGAQATDLTYTRFASKLRSKEKKRAGGDSLPSRAARNLLSVLPDSLFAAAGAALYRHIG